MKKLTLAAAIAATAVNVQATTYNISSVITGSQLFLGNGDDETANSMVFGGSIEIDGLGAGNAWSVSADQLDAKATLTGGQSVATGLTELTYDLTGTASTSGIDFEGDIFSVCGCEPYDTFDATISNISFESSATWQTLPIGGIDVSGGTINGDGTITIAFNGLWTGPQPLAYFDAPAAAALATGTGTVFGNAALLYLEGELILTAEVPVPAAMWLFGSALIGLAGIKRRK